VDRERWQRVAELYELVLEREPGERGAVLAAASAGDDELRREVESLLEQEQAQLLIDRPVLEAAASVLDDQPDLKPGSRLGPYQIERLLGAGGMGQVYLATDTRLGRAVAVKILPRALAVDPRFRARFDREAHAIAGLTHPHICTLYDVGRHQPSTGSGQAVDFLAMEYVDGETLAARLEKGRLPFNQALTIAIDIADALAAAHQQGIVHRDLKPGNIMLTRHGAKLLDFGLARPASSGLQGASRLPTMPSALTAQGTIVGTVPYMAPEQFEGKDSDTRTDVFAFGAVVYEMLTGQRAFDGQSQASLMGAIMHADPPAVSVSQPLAPPTLDRIVQVCLAKDADDRWQSSRDLLHELQWVRREGAAGTTRTSGAAAAAARRSTWLLSALAAALAVAAVSTALAIRSLTRADRPSVSAVHVSLELGGELIALADSALAVAPDGATIAFSGRKGTNGPRLIYVRRLDQLEARPLAGTDDGRNPFFSPDGRSVAFFAGGKLCTVPAAGGNVTTLADAPSDRGGSWAPDGTIIYSPSASRGRGLMKVAAAGGSAQPVTRPQDNEVTHRWPQVLPGGAAVLYTAHSQRGNYDRANLVVSSLDGSRRQTIVRGGYYGRYLSSGHLVYIQNGTLLVAPFDLDRLVVTASAVPLIEGVTSDPTVGVGLFAFSDRGVLIYSRGPGSVTDVTISWIEQTGLQPPMRSAPGDYFNLRFSPDGQRLAMEVGSNRGEGAIWTYDWARETMTRVTLGNGEDAYPVWSPDGKRIAFAAQRDGALVPNIYWQKADGSGHAERLIKSDTPQIPWSWHPSGKFLTYQTAEDRVPELNIGILPLDGNEATGWKVGRPSLILSESYAEAFPAFSPDGTWLAYASDESGKPEVFVRPFPGLQSRTKVSVDGGVHPTWAPTGRGAREGRLFYVSLDAAIWVVSYQTIGDAFVADKPRLWAPAGVLLPRARSFDLHPDGRRFAALKGTSPPERQHLSLMMDAFGEVRRVLQTPAR
jgi:Tol biopolymer transport system component